MKRIKPTTEKITKADLRPRRTRIYNHARDTFTNCPICNSRLIIGADKGFQCTGDRLKILEDEFKVYNDLTELEQLEYLRDYSDSNTFTELYTKWKYCQDEGIDFECEFNARVAYSNANYQTLIPDPVTVASKERMLKRPLTEEELEEIPKINFPDDV